MGNYLQSPALEKHTDGGVGPGFKWGGAGMQGWRNNMEDAHIMQPELCDRLKTFSFFTVFDGHSGKVYADKVAAEFVAYLLERKPFDTLKDGDPYDINEIKETIRQAFLDYDTMAQSDKAIQECHAGCTVTGVLLTPKHFFFYNIGDSRSFIVRGTDEIVFSTADHKPSNDEERRRIEAAGGFLKAGRVNGMLAVSRALGDFELKSSFNMQQIEQKVSAEADVTCIDRDTQDNFILICCDGVFDVQRNDELLDYITARLPTKYELKDLMEELIDYCCFKGSKDNMSAIILHFNDSPLPLGREPEAKEEDDWNINMKKNVENYVTEKFTDGRSAFNWENCYKTLQMRHGEMFDKIPEQFGKLVLKKGMIYLEFLKHTERVREKRALEARQKMEADKRRRDAERTRRRAAGEPESSDEDDDFSDFI